MHEVTAPDNRSPNLAAPPCLRDLATASEVLELLCDQCGGGLSPDRDGAPPCGRCGGRGVVWHYEHVEPALGVLRVRDVRAYLRALAAHADEEP